MLTFAREDQRTVAHNRVQYAQQSTACLRHHVRITMLLTIDAPLHPRSGHGPERPVEIDLGPGRRSQFVRALKSMGAS